MDVASGPAYNSLQQRLDRVLPRIKKRGPQLADTLHNSARLVSAVTAGKSVSSEFERHSDADRGSSRAALLDFVQGTLRRYGRVQAILRALSRKAETDPMVASLLWCALYALESKRHAPYVVVDQAVKACKLAGRSGAKGYVNAILRNYLRHQGATEAQIASNPEARYWHPAWWIEILRRSYPKDWEPILQAGNMHPPMCLRVNRRRCSVEDYTRRLTDQGLQTRPLGNVGLLLSRPVPVIQLPGFTEGDVSVQDSGAQHAAEFLDVDAGHRVLDACAAPGGKAAHILEIADVSLTALDNDHVRAERMQANFARLGLDAKVAIADCSALSSWWDGEPFHRVLADVPCSSSGVARRIPDIKWLRRKDDTQRYAARQYAILEALWNVLAPDGKLLYVTCSVFPAENDDVVNRFVATAPNARRLELPGGARAQILPCAERDGFYYALIQKSA